MSGLAERVRHGLYTVRNEQHLDAVLQMAAADPHADLRGTLAFADTDALRRLASALGEGSVTRRSFTRRGLRSRREGCILYWLFGFTGNEPLLNYPFGSDTALGAACRTARFWDRGPLSPEVVGRIVAEELAHRERLNAAEDRAVRSSQRGLRFHRKETRTAAETRASSISAQAASARDR